MKLVTPDYYLNFQCSADLCKDNCCIGWEIDIDDQTADLYRNTECELKQKLKKSIRYGTPNTFILDRNERCPFLDSHNLCQIITAMGKKSLCQICRDHPRYFEWYDGIKEGGIGLCCEEAARLILSESNHNFSEKEIPYESCDSYDINMYNCLYQARCIIIGHLCDNTIPLSSRICDILDYCELLQYSTDNNDFSLPDFISSCGHNEYDHTDIRPILDFLRELDPINDKWPEYISDISKRYDQIKDTRYTENESVKSDIYLQNIMIYFIWRYFLKGVFDGEFLSRIKLAAVSTAVISYMFLFLKTNGNFSLDSCAQAAKNYSKEIEYSDENMSEFLDASYEQEFFSTEKIKGLFF